MRKKVKQKKPLHQQIKHWLVPHKHNDHRPHLIRAHGLALMAVLIVGVQLSANFLRPPSVQVLAYATNITPVDILNLTNQERTAAGLPAFHLDAKLNQSAALKAQNMFAEDYWAHVSPSGIQPWHWFQQAGYVYTYAGENLAKDFDTSSGAVQGWMNSAGHRANILNRNYTDVGFAVQNGTIQGGQTTLVVAHYGATAATGVASAPAPAAPTAPKAAPKAAPKTVVPAATPVPTAVPTPEATPVPTQTPTPTPSTSATPTPVIASGQFSTPSAPAPQSYSLFKPLSLVRTLNFGTIVTILLLLLLLGVYTATHLAVWRKGLRRWESAHYRLLAAGQVSGLTAAILLLSVSGFGSVG